MDVSFTDRDGDGRRILVVANETVTGRALLAEIKRRADGTNSEVLVVCPALNSRLRHWLSDVDGAREAANRRLDSSLAALAQFGIAADGIVGDTDPVQAIVDALRTFEADEILISTHPPGRSNWLEAGVVERVRAEQTIPVTHVLVDLELEAAGHTRPRRGALRLRALRRGVRR